MYAINVITIGLATGFFNIYVSPKGKKLYQVRKDFNLDNTKI